MSTIDGGNHADPLIGTGSADDISGGNGNDVILAGGGNDDVSGDNGNDIVSGGTGDDTIEGGSGNDILSGDDGDDDLDGGNGADILTGGAGDDSLDGGNGLDTAIYLQTLSSYRFNLLADGSIRIIDLSNGDTDTVRNVELFVFLDAIRTASSLPFTNDTLDYSWTTQGVVVDLAAGTATGPEIGNQAISGYVNVIGGSGDDILLGDGQANQLFGRDGNDILGGRPADDLLDGGNGLDQASFIQATAGVSIALAAGTATVGTSTDTLRSIELARGGDFGDIFDATGFSGSSTNAGSNGTFNEFEGRGGNDTITGNGNTRVSYASATAAVTVNLGAGTATGDASVGTDTIVGGVNAARGSQFNDDLRGTTGDDILEGRDGDDFLGGGAGSDILDGGNGFDTVGYGMAIGPVTVDLQAGTTIAGPETDTLIGIEAANGSTFNDTLRGSGVANTLNGNDGNDFLVGRGGDDLLNGGNGIDIARFSGNRSAYTFAPSTVTGPDGTDTTNSVELLRFDDAYMMGVALTPINLTNFGGLDAGVALFGRGVSDQVTMGANANGRLIDFGADNDTLTLGVPGPGSQTYSLNLANIETLNGSTADETVNMSSTITNNMLVNLDGGNDQLNLGNGNDTVTVQNVETVFGFGGTDTVTFVHNDPFVGQTFDLGFGGTDTLILTGTNGSFGLTIGGDMTVVGATTTGDEDVSLLNVQGGSTFDLGAGTDALHLFNNGVNVNVVTVRNVESVTAFGFDSDQITIAGNTGGTTTVTAGGGADFITASADSDHFRFTVTGDSLYDVPAGGLRDTVTGFDASEDAFVFDGPQFTGPVAWELINFGGQDIVRIDIDGDAVGETGWDMAVGLNGLVGTLTNANFLVV
jgi:Ca2+-binding RTX toxin-like protein